MASGKKRCTYNEFSFTIEKGERTLLPFFYRYGNETRFTKKKRA